MNTVHYMNDVHQVKKKLTTGERRDGGALGAAEPSIYILLLIFHVASSAAGDATPRAPPCLRGESGIHALNTMPGSSFITLRMLTSAAMTQISSTATAL